jgi:hypothetical protein
MDNYMLRVLGSANQTISAQKMEPQKILYIHKQCEIKHMWNVRFLALFFSSISPEWATATRGRVQLVKKNTALKEESMNINKQTNKLRGLLFASELYRQNDGRLSAKLMPTFADRGCCVVSSTDPYDRIIGFLDRCRYYFFQVAPQLY